MIGRVVEIANDDRALHVARGFLVVTEQSSGTELGRVPLDDVLAVIAYGIGTTFSNGLLARLCERNTPLVIVDRTYNPVGMLLATVGNIQQARRFDAQIAASRPTRKRIWADIVRAKVANQAALLSAVAGTSNRLTALAQTVRSGDPTNVEAQAARLYWRMLFGAGFRRDRTAGGINALLNYGYAITRAATARAVVAAGLHPTLGIHHSNVCNGYRLVDDLMEPFRPHVDAQVWLLAASGRTRLDPPTKRDLVDVLSQDLKCDAGRRPVSVCLQSLAISVASVFLGDSAAVELPSPQVTGDAGRRIARATGHRDSA